MLKRASRLRKNSIVAQYATIHSCTVWVCSHPQAAQKGRPARPQQAKRRIVLAPYGEPLRFTTRGITRGTFVNAAEPVRRPCLARMPLADFWRILLGRGSRYGPNSGEGPGLPAESDRFRAIHVFDRPQEPIVIDLFADPSLPHHRSHQNRRDLVV